MSLDVPVWVPVALGFGVFVAYRAGRFLFAVVLAVALAAVTGLLPHLLSSTTAGGPLAQGTVPEEYREWIERAGSRCPDVTPALLAAQLRQESGFNPRASSPVGAQGIAQFMPGTWPTWAVDANGNGTASPWEPADAITAQGAFMCSLAQAARTGLADGRLRGSVVELALAGYNAGFGRVQRAGGVPRITETTDYVRLITATAAEFSTSPLPGEPS